VSEQRFRYSDFFDPGLLREISQVRDAFRQVRREAEAIKRVMPAKYSGAKDYKKTTTSQQEMNKVMKEYEAVMKAVERLDKRIEAERIKQTATIRRKVVELDKERQKTREKLAEDRREILSEREKQKARAALEKQRQRSLAAMAKEEHSQRQLMAVANMEVKSIEDLRRKNNALIKVRDRLDITTKKGQARFDQLTAAIKRNSDALMKAEGAAGRYNRNVGNYGSALSGLGGRMMGALGIAGGIYGAVRVLRNAFNIVSDFDQKMANVKAITSATQEEFEKLKDNAIELGATTVFKATQIAELQTAYGKLGFSIQEILDATRATQDLAAATQEGLAESAVVVGNTIRGFGMDAKEAARVTDVMARSFTSSALDLTKFSESMKYVAPIAREVGLEVEEVSAMLSVLADSGISGSMAGTSLRMMLLRLATTGRPVKEALQDMTTSTMSLTEANDEFGQRAMVAAMILNKNKEQVDGLTESYKKAKDAAKEMAEIQLDTLSGEITLLGSAWEGFITSLEDGQGKLAKAVRFSTKVLTTSLNTLTKWAKGEKVNDFQKDPYGLDYFKATYGEAWEEAKRLNDKVDELREKQAAMKKYLKAGQVLEETPKYKTYLAEINKAEEQLWQMYAQHQKSLAEQKKLIDEQNQAKEQGLDIEMRSLRIAELKAKLMEAEMTGDDVMAERIKIELEQRQKAFDAQVAALRESEELTRLDDQLKKYTVDLLDWMEQRDATIKKRTEDLSKAREAAMNVWFDIPQEEETIDEESPAVRRALAEASFQMEMTRQTYAYQKQQLDEALEHGEMGWTQYNKKVAELNHKQTQTIARHAQSLMSTLSGFFSQQQSLYQQMENQKLDDLQARLTAGLLSEQAYEEEREQLQRAYAKKRQSIEIAQAYMQGAQVVLNALQVKPWWVALTQGVIATTMVARQIGMIKSQKFKKGEVDVSGPKHEQGGIAAEIEGGESVINAQATARAKRTLQMINEGLLTDKDIYAGLAVGQQTLIGQVRLEVHRQDQELISIQKQLLTETQRTNDYLKSWKWISEDGKTIRDVNGNTVKYV
jgi:hypothetical protein